MHAAAILCRCLPFVFESMHKRRARRLLGAVEALAAGSQLTLTGLSRHWPGATWVHAPLKALDRLLSNAHLHCETTSIHRAVSAWLLASRPRPVVLVDWADLKGDGRSAVLRASLPAEGRALTLCEQVFPLKRMGQPGAQHEFLQRLRDALPSGVRPIIVTDAGFRSDWFRAVRRLGWDYIGRIRNNTCVRSEHSEWQPCAALHAMARRSAVELGAYDIVRASPLACRLVTAYRARKGRDEYTRQGVPSKGRTAVKARKSAREPWLLATSLDNGEMNAHKVIAAYAKRMQIEEAFRDLKSHRFGMGFEDSQTRDLRRIGVLLLVHSLTGFAAWLLSQAAHEADVPDPMTRQATHANRYSKIRRGLEWLRRAAWPAELQAALDRLLMQPLWPTE